MSRETEIKTPEEMWKHFEAFVLEKKGKPYEVTDWVGGIGKEVKRKKERPLTLEGFHNYLFRNKIVCNAKHYFNNTNKKYDKFLTICETIRDIIREDQIEGGMTGMYNHSLTARLNGLTDKQETKMDINGSLDITLNL